MVIKYYYSEEGYLTVTSVLGHKSFIKYNLADIERVVNNNVKQRFKLRLNPNTKLLEVKANQGHSIEIVSNVELTPILEVSHTNFKSHNPQVNSPSVGKFCALTFLP